MQLLVVSALAKLDIIGDMTAKYCSSPAGLHFSCLFFFGFVCLFLFVFSFHLRKHFFVVQCTVKVVLQLAR